MNYLCNPVIGHYRYQFTKNPMNAEISLYREAADPSILLFQDTYYLFASMTLSVWTSKDLIHWEEQRLPDILPLQEYAPDACVHNNVFFLCSCSGDQNGKIYVTKDLFNGPYEIKDLPFPVNDPKLFFDLDDRLYLFWGLSDETPIWGIELDALTLAPIGQPSELLFSDPFIKGFERIGENHQLSPRTQGEIEQIMKSQGIVAEQLQEDRYKMIYSFLSQRPYIEGAWINRYKDNYYLQYAFAGTQYNIYGDAVYISKSPLGPYSLAKNNPFSYSPGSFFPGAGHGSTFEDVYGNYWHSATMRISVNHNFERRIGIWPAGFDAEGELFCNQRFPDWPIQVPACKKDPWASPSWMLLSYGKKAFASSEIDGHEANCCLDENNQTWWTSSGEDHPWLKLDLQSTPDIYAIQINFADDFHDFHDLHNFHEIEKNQLSSHPNQDRHIEEGTLYTRWVLEGSIDDLHYTLLEDKSVSNTDFAHDFIVLDEPTSYRYLKLTVIEVPYKKAVSISGFRVFGLSNGPLPSASHYQIETGGNNEKTIRIHTTDTSTVGHVILWGHEEKKLYHSCLTYSKEVTLKAFVKGIPYFFRVDSFNESGVTEGILTVL